MPMFIPHFLIEYCEMNIAAYRLLTAEQDLLTLGGSFQHEWSLISPILCLLLLSILMRELRACSQISYSILFLVVEPLCP